MGIFYSVVKVFVVIIAVAGLVSFSGKNACAEEAAAKGKAKVAVAEELPKDVYPESRFRLPLPKREDFDEEGKKIFDKRVGKGARSIRGLMGPSGIRLHSPKLAEITNPVSQYLRFETGFSGRVRELAILVTAREVDSQFEWAAHEPEALKEGLPMDIIEVVKYRKPLAGVPEPDATIIQLGREMFNKKKVTSETFARAAKIYNSKQLVDLVHLMINYQGTAVMLTTFDIQLDPGQKPMLPMP